MLSVMDRNANGSTALDEEGGYSSEKDETKAEGLQRSTAG